MNITPNLESSTASRSDFATFTVLTTDNGILTKEVSLGEDGEARKTSTPNFSGGSYQIVSVESLNDFLAARRSLKSDQALMYSTPINGTQSGVITTKKRRSAKKLSRSKDCFAHPSGSAILAVDYDSRSGTKPLTRQQLITCLTEAIPDLRKTQLLWATSAGSCIHDAVTGKRHFGVRGQRVYILVKDGRDINRALRALAERLWLAGHGWIKVSKSGAKLKRTLVDLALANPVQPDFAAGAVCYYPFEQRSQQKLIGAGGPLDTGTAIPALRLRERNLLDKIYKAADDAAEDESRAARALWLVNYSERAVQHAVAAGRVLTDAEIEEIRNNAVAAIDSGFLAGDFLVTLEDRTEVTVAEILDNPTHYHEALCCDPLEPEYDNYRVVGKIFVGDSSSCIHSYAHGGQTFVLVRDQSEVDGIGTTARRVSRLHDGIAPHYQTTHLTKQQAEAKLDFAFRKQMGLVR